MILFYIAVSAGVGIAVAAAAGRFAWIAGGLLTLLGLGPMVALIAYDSLIGIAGDPSSVSMLATLASVLILPSGIAALATAWIRH